MIKKQVGVDIESIGTDLFGGLVWSVAMLMPNRKVKLDHDCMGLYYLNNEMADLLEDEDVDKIMQNAAFDVPYMRYNLFRKDNGKPIIVRGFIHDTDVTEQIVQAVSIGRKMSDDDEFYQEHGTRLDLIMKRYRLNTKMNKSLVYRFIDRPKGKPFDKAEINYMIGDVDKMDKLRYMQEKVLKRDDQWEVYLLEMEFLKNVIIPEKIKGVGLDAEFWVANARANKKEYERRLRSLPKEVENWGSEKQVKQYFEKRGIFIPSYKVLDDVYAQTGDKVLKKFIDARSLYADVTKYGEDWVQFIGPDGRVRPRIRQMVDTGRMSVSDPPMHGLHGRYREAIVPAKGNIFVGIDFPSQEIAIMAAMAKEKVWVDALLRGDDVHSLTAYLIDPDKWKASASKGCTFPKKCKCPGHAAMRQPAKVNNFLLAYGGGPKKLMLQTGMSWIDAKIFCVKHKKSIPKLTAKLEQNAKLALNTGEVYSADPYRRRRRLTSTEGWHIENQGKNSPIQMAGANMMKLTAISVPEKYYVVFIIHDEIWLEVPKKEAKAAKKTLESVACKAADYITGIKGLIKAEAKIAMNISKD